MKMKSRIQFLIYFSLLLAPIGSLVRAESTIEGLAVGENIGILHLNYSTADYNSSTAPSPQTDSTYHFGPRNEFYIRVNDDNYSAPFNFDSTFVFNVSDLADTPSGSDYLEVCDKPNQICPLHGFIWSDAIGWIVADGNIIRGEGFPSSPGDFANDYYARVGYDGLFRGFMWSEKAGWIQLSSGSAVSTLISRYDQGQEQTSTDWGVWMYTDQCDLLNQSQCTDLGRDEICNWNSTLSECQDNGDPYGRLLHGNAWSEKLGWINFDASLNDLNDPDEPDDPALDEREGTTTWIPDLSPPIVRVTEDNIWFANNTPTGAISWPEFAVDPQSGIEESDSTFTVTLDPNPMFSNCSASIAIDQYENDRAVNLLLSGSGGNPAPGILTNVQAGFCKYTITGTLMNGAGLTTPVGPLTFFVRAGDYDPNSSFITADPDNMAIADGDDFIVYHFFPRDLAGNPILPVEVDSTGTSALRTDWMRDVNSTFKFISLFHFDAINNTTAGSIPVRINDLDVSSGGTIYNDMNGTITFPKGSNYSSPVGLQYQAQVSGFSPTILCGDDCINTFNIDGITLDVDNAEMPAITDPIRTLNQVTPASFDSYEIDGTTSLLGVNPFTDPLDTVFEFMPTLTTSSNAFDTQVISLETPLTVTFAANNESATTTLTDVSFDSLLDLNNQITDGDLYGEEVLDIRQIGMIGDTDGKTGQSDPVASTPINTCYELTTRFSTLQTKIPIPQNTAST